MNNFFYNARSEYLDKKPVDFLAYSEYFLWDFRLHFPIPTIKEVQARTGIDMSIECGSEVIAKQILITIARGAKNQIFNRVPYQEQVVALYLLSREKDFIDEVLEFEMECIHAGINTGSFLNIYKIGKLDTLIPALEDAKNTVAIKSRMYRGLTYIPKELLFVGY